MAEGKVAMDINVAEIFEYETLVKFAQLIAGVSAGVSALVGVRTFWSSRKDEILYPQEGEKVPYLTQWGGEIVKKSVGKKIRINCKTHLIK
jgi:hypothetical protein